ncbi:hypothetical protein [Streptomyces massasporeus]
MDEEPSMMVTHRPRIQLGRVPDAAHDVHLDQPTRLRGAIAAFLRG